MQKRKELSDDITEDEAEEEEIDEIRSKEDTTTREKINARDKGESEREDGQIGKCAVCHVIIDDTNFCRSVTDSEHDPRCSDGYLLCQRCVRKISARSGR